MNSVELNKSTSSYRPEIDGLRAIAVISVILYHAKFIFLGKDWFEGGFIGVDIFFVISGYLISRIILSEYYSSGSFSFLNFFARRARRLLPMLFLVILVSIPFAWLILLPSALVEYAQSILSSIFFSSNFFFYYNTTEYGADSALLKPFLHTWSLGVEEQFYLIYPLVITLCVKYFKDHLLIIIVGLSLISLQFAQIMDVKNEDLNFYLPFSRFWELTVGSILAIRELSERKSYDYFGAKLFPLFGLILLVYSILFFNSETHHPGYQTMIPIIGVALIIGFSSGNDLIGKILGSKPFVSIGLISYSAYLWHYPIFAFLRIGSAGANNTDKLGWVVITIVLSVISYFVIERTMRNRDTVSDKRLFRTLIFSASISLIVMLLIIFNKGYETRFKKIEGFLNYEIDNKKLKKESWSIILARLKEKPNFYDVSNKVLIVGNSHAKDIFNMLYLNRDKFQDYDFLRIKKIEQLSCFDEQVSDYEKMRKVFYNTNQYKSATTILISTRYTKNICYGKDRSRRKADDLEGLRFLIKRAKKDGKKVLVMGHSPEFKVIDKKWVADYIYDSNKEVLETVNLDIFDAIRDEANKLLYKQLNHKKTEITKKVQMISQNNNVGFYDKFNFTCDDTNKRCDAFTEEGYKIFYDFSHYTLEGAKFFGEKLAKDETFKQLLIQ